MTACAGRTALWAGLAAIMAGAAASPYPALAQQDLQRIAAIVNDDIISFFDLDARVTFMIASTNAPNTPETHKRFQQQVLKTLIDERLQKQEASKNNVKVTEQEIIAWCKEQFAAYKYPRSVEFRDSLPVSPTGKLLKRELKGQKA